MDTGRGPLSRKESDVSGRLTESMDGRGPNFNLSLLPYVLLMSLVDGRED